MNYKIISEINPVKFGMQITEHINEGWELQGGVSIIKDNTIHYYYQAMIKNNNMVEKILEPKSELQNKSTFTLLNRHFKIDFDKVQTIDDIKIVLQAMDLHIYWNEDKCPERFKEVYDKGFLIEIK
jgi:hypothetical protein